MNEKKMKVTNDDLFTAIAVNIVLTFGILVFMALVAMKQLGVV